MRGIILAGGTGSRLFPLTVAGSKHLLPVYDKPLVYYPLTTLLEHGVRHICLITTSQEQYRFQELLRDGSDWGMRIEYRIQERPAGIAESLLIAESFVGNESVALILGDNVFCGPGIAPAFESFANGATVFAYQVHHPQRYGVIEFDHSGMAVSIEEKPTSPKTDYAVPGLYLYDAQAAEIARRLKPSSRGELEITDVNHAYLERGQLRVQVLGRGFAWLDAGSTSTLHEASALIQTLEQRQGVKIGCPEETSFRKGYISLNEFVRLAERMPPCEYRDYLLGISERGAIRGGD